MDITSNHKNMVSFLKEHKISMDLFYVVSVCAFDVKLQGYVSNLEWLQEAGLFKEYRTDGNGYLQSEIMYEGVEITIVLT